MRDDSLYRIQGFCGDNQRLHCSTHLLQLGMMPNHFLILIPLL